MRCIVITTVYPPSQAVHRFALLSGWNVIVVGDRKTPEPWQHDNVRYVSVAEQETCSFKVARLLPWNHYCRKLIGYLVAIYAGAEIIADIDDDNLPKESWNVPSFEGEFDCTPGGLGFVNIYKNFTEIPIWPRGFPLRRINDPATRILDRDIRRKRCRLGVWQALADGDADVDAIYRLTNNQSCTFRSRDPLVLDAGTWCPFNSQNSAVIRKLFPLLYLPATVTFRFTDILRSLVGQPIMQAAGYFLGFTTSTVFQERNPHDYLKDFASEIPCYLHSERVIEIVTAAVEPTRGIFENLSRAYEELYDAKIVEKEELSILKAWLEDFSQAERRSLEC